MSGRRYARYAPLAAGIALLLGLFLYALPEPHERRAAAAAPGFAIRDVRVFDDERTLPRTTVDIRKTRAIATIWKNGATVERQRYPLQR